MGSYETSNLEGKGKSVSNMSIWGILLITTEIPPDVTHGSRSRSQETAVR